jgi:hypothetical protein
MKTNKQPIEEQIDAIISTLTADPATEQEARSGVQLQEAWRKARELIVDHQLRLMLRVESRRCMREQDAGSS